MESLERLPTPSADRFSAEALSTGIERNFRPNNSAWQKLETAPVAGRDQLVKQYLEEVDEERDIMVGIAREQGRPTETLLLIQTMYGSEMVRAWAMNRPIDREADFQNLLGAVRWQNDVAAYLFAVDRKADIRTQRNTLTKFWQSFRTILGSTASPAEREKLGKTIGEYKRGILRPFAVGYALSHENDWDVYPPEDPHDDADNKIDLVAETADDHYFLIQIKPADSRDIDLGMTDVPLDEPLIDSDLEKFRVGANKYITKYHLDPAETKAVFVRISAKEESIDGITGVPQDELKATIAAQFRTIDKNIAK